MRVYNYHEVSPQVSWGYNPKGMKYLVTTGYNYRGRLLCYFLVCLVQCLSWDIEIFLNSVNGIEHPIPVLLKSKGKKEDSVLRSKYKKYTKDRRCLE